MGLGLASKLSAGWLGFFLGFGFGFGLDFGLISFDSASGFHFLRFCLDLASDLAWISVDLV